MRTRFTIAATGLGLAALLSACGSPAATTPAASTSGSASATSSGTAGGDWILGTTETITALDPAGAYDVASWNLQYSMFQQLVVIPQGKATEVGDAAQSCDYSDPKTLTCKLRPGLKFSNGHSLTSSDVKFSFERNLKIADPNGASVLLASIGNGDEKNPGMKAGAIETPDDATVTFHLNNPDTTFVKVLTTAAASIVDEEVFPADKLLADDKVVGSGPYALAGYTKGQQAVFKANENYTGDRVGKAKQVFIQFYKEAGPLKQAIESGEVDVAWRELSPTDYNDIKSKGQLDVLEGQGSSFRYWVWQFGTETGKQKAIRQAVAQLIDRDAIVKNAYDGTVTPSYSIVPPTFAGAKESFKTKYGTPDKDKAKALLDAAGIKTPVAIKLGYTPSHYGPNAVDEANELKGQLEASGLFSVKVDSAEWEQYQTLYKQKAYDLFILGWYPDFLDADNYLAPFVVNGGFYQNGYKSDKANQLVTAEQGETDTTKREELIGQLQDLVADDVPLIPSWNGKNVAVASKKMSGVLDTLDPTYIFRFWTIAKNG